MNDIGLASHSTLRAADRTEAAAGTVTLDYATRFLRRKRLVTDAGEGFLVDLPATTSLEAGDCFVLTDGRLVEVRPGEET